MLALFRIVRAALALSPPDAVDVGAKRLIATLAESGPVRPSELAATANLDLSTVSRHLSSLEAGGLVQRSKDSTDRRACVVQLTAEGSDLLTRMIDHRVATLAPVLRGWDAADRESLFELLLRLADEMQVRASARPGAGR